MNFQSLAINSKPTHKNVIDPTKQKPTNLEHVNTIPTIIDTNQYSITFSISRRDATTACTSIYASPNHTMYPTLWTYLTNLSHTITGPWMLIGDFNETLLLWDQRGGIFNQNRVDLFANLVNYCNFLDLTTIGGVSLGTTIKMV